MSKKSSNGIVGFHYQVKDFSFRGRNKLKARVVELFRREMVKLVGLDYIFCSDAFLLEINREFLRHDFYTDIITFQGNRKGEPVEGEVYISIDRVRENAIIYKVPFSRELHRVIFHGALHLCGYRDKTRAEARKMREMEEKYLGAS